MEMFYCPICGTRLKAQEHPTDGIVAYCERCGDYRFPLFSTAVSIVVLNPERTQMILIRQYGEPWEVLAAGYVVIWGITELSRLLPEKYRPVPFAVRGRAKAAETGSGAGPAGSPAE